MVQTRGINHVGLAVRDLDATCSFFVDCLGWKESGRDDNYPRTFVSDGKVLLTLWQVDHSLDVQGFNRRRNIGLHHLALTVPTEDDLDALARRVAAWPGVEIEFMPEPLRGGPRRHMMMYEPGGIRLEFIWPGE